MGCDLKPLINLSRPLVAPPEKVRPFAQVCLELAKRLGEDVARYFPFAKLEEYYAALAEGHAGLKAAGGLNYLQEKGFWSDDSQPRVYDLKKFPTPSGRIEIYSRELKTAGYSPLPEYVSIASHGEKAEDEFVLITFKVNVQGHSRTQNDKWLSEIYHHNPLLIHPQAAAKRGIAEGDTVKLISAHGQVQAKAQLSEGIHPQAVGLSVHGGHWAFGRVARAKPFASHDPDTRLLWWHEEGNGTNINSIIPARFDPVGRGEAAMDTVVKVERA
jgi:anaerobic selenocysteine-containing dehydrogenase